MLSLLSGCFDPRFPVDVKDPASIPVPPKIDEERVEPTPTTTPFVVNIGDGCQRETFRVGSVTDADLPPEGRLLARWHLTVRIDVQEFGPTLLEETELKHTGTDPGAEFAVPDFSITKEQLSARFLGQVPALVGNTHLLEFHITDASFIADTFEVTPETADADSAYWWIRIEDDVCPE